jgi:hypothetical protein
MEDREPHLHLVHPARTGGRDAAILSCTPSKRRGATLVATLAKAIGAIRPDEALQEAGRPTQAGGRNRRRAHAVLISCD